MDRPVCSVAVCDRPAWARGLCRAHHQRWRTTGDPGRTPVRPVQDRDGPCTVRGCDRIRKTAGLCGAHYWRSRVHGDPGPAEIMTSGRDRARSSGATGGRSAADSAACTTRGGGRAERSALPPRGGGRREKAPSRRATSWSRSRRDDPAWRSQSSWRACWAARSRRARPSTTSTADRSDNTTDGPLDERYRSGHLELWSSWQPAGQRVSDKIEYAQDLLRRYAPHLLAPDGGTG